ncbi:sulfotransferase domain-containing protein [Rubrivirga sp.]|uniref:sulfotransferase domain-containing protein n=1 Tax=Rubrivirga sp. TaxID=1885344 RepID=UPI003B51578C
MATPDFLIAGAAKCGTTALWHLLDAHPGVGMTYIKEPRFFTREEGGLERGVVDTSIPRSGTYDRGPDWYRELWRDAPPGAVLGEASTVYFVAPDAPALIRAHAPDARLIVMVRDPVDRMYSHYWQERKAGWDWGEFRALVADDHPRVRYYESTSHYRAHVERFLEHFDRDQILLLAKEDLDDEPERVLTEVFAFVGVDPAFRPRALGRRFNRQRMPRYPWLRRLADRARATVGARLPHGARQALGRTQRGIERRLSTPIEYPPLAADLRAELVPRFEADIAFVEDWLGRPRPGWRAVREPGRAPSARPSATP